jgi:voltage-gated potassium channel
MAERTGTPAHMEPHEVIPEYRSSREIRWDNATTWPMIMLSLVFLIAYSIMILDDQPFRGRIDEVILGIIGLTYVAFIVDYFVRMHLSGNRLLFFRKNGIDLVSLVIPLLRPLLLLEYLGRLRFFRTSSGASVRARLALYTSGAAVLFIYVISLAVYASERHAPGASITSFGDAVWWAMSTISTVGYGDVVPVTVPGRIFAVMLMLGGVAIVGAATAAIVSAINERVAKAHQRSAHLAHEQQSSKTPPKK